MGCSPSDTTAPAWVLQVLPGASFSRISAQAAVPAWHLHLIWPGILHGLQCGHLLHHRLPVGCLGTSPGSCLEHLLHFLLLWPWCLQDCFSHLFYWVFFSSFLASCAVFGPFSNMFSWRHHQHCSWARRWSAVSPFLSRLELTLSDGIFPTETTPATFLPLLPKPCHLCPIKWVQRSRRHSQMNKNCHSKDPVQASLRDSCTFDSS